MLPRVYIETTIVSYLAARPSRDIILAAHQQITDEWWHNRRVHFDLYTAQPVIDEAAEGDAEVARERLEKLAPLPLLDITEEVANLAESLIRVGPLPQKAAVDAVHIAAATVHGMDYLLTWNCKHIANAAMRNKIEAVIRSSGYEPLFYAPRKNCWRNRDGKVGRQDRSGSASSARAIRRAARV